MKAVLWISFLLFAAFMGGGYYYYSTVYVPKQAAIRALEEAKLAQMQADIEAEKARIKRRQMAKPAPQKNTEKAKAVSSDLSISMPKAGPVSNRINSMPDSLSKAKPKVKTPEEIKQEEELAKLRVHLRAMKAEGERGS